MSALLFIQSSIVGQKLRDIELPADKITSCCFGGKDYSELYVTTAKGFKPEQIAQDLSPAGSIFRVTGLGTKGVAAHNYSPK